MAIKGRIKLMEYQEDYIENRAAEFVAKQPDEWEWKGKKKEYWLEYFKANTPKTRNWSDYAIYLINSQETKWIRENWQKKIETSIRHWSHTGSAVQEKIRDAFLVLSDTKNMKFSQYKEPYTKGLWWDQVGNADISRMPIIKVFKYPEDSAENQARFYIEKLIEGLKSDKKEMKEEALKEIYDNNTLRTILFGENGTMENITNLPKSLYYIVHPWTSLEDLVNIPSGKECRMRILGADGVKDINRVRDSCNMEELIKALENGSRRYFRDDVKNSCSWKRVTIMCLRNDVNGTYMGFSPSTEMRMLREQGMAAFSAKKEEKEKALKKYEALKAKLAKEKEEEKLAKEQA